MSRSARIIALALSLVSCLPILLWIGSSQPLRPPAVKIQDNPQGQQEDRTKEPKAQSPKPFWVEVFEPVPLFTLGILLFTAVLAVSTIGLWLATWRIGDRQYQDTRILQRAYLWVEIGSIRSLTGEAGFVPRIVIRNAGHLPAKKVGWVFGEPNFTTENEWKPTVEPGTPRGEITLAPGAEMTHGSQTLLIQQDQFAPRTYLYVWGYVRYHDGFEDGRITQFCHRYNLSRLWWDKEGKGLRVFAKQHSRYNRYHNDAT